MAATNEKLVIQLLKAMAENSRTIVTVVPPDTEIVNIDLNTREIQLGSSAHSDFISVAREHYAETIYFRVPRYFDGVDLLRMSVVVEYVNAAGESRMAPILVEDVTSEPGYIIFGWCIHGDATRVAGNLKFAIRFYSINLNTNEFVYSLRTLPAIGKIMYGTPDDFEEQESLYSEELQQIIESLKQKSMIYWTNV